MKKKNYYVTKPSSDFDDRPIYEPEDNLYADAEPEQAENMLNGVKYSKTRRNSNKIEENDGIDG